MGTTIERLLKDQHDNYILPFFWQHGEDEETLRDYMRAIHEANIGAVCVESRPHPDFCGDKWWQDMDVILDEARKRHMQVWILDDSHFPTGFANGAMADAPKGLERRSVCCQKYQVKAGETFSLTKDQVMHPDEKKMTAIEKQIAMMMGKSAEQESQASFLDDVLLGIAVWYGDGTKKDLTYLVKADGSFSFTSDQDAVIYKMNHTRNRGPHMDYINMTDRESCRVLIDAVYEKHYEHYSADFGTTIAGFFSDEPELGNGHLYDLHHELGIGFEMDYPWGKELEEELRGHFGTEFAALLPLIWETEGDEAKRAEARYAYMDHLTRLVEKNFSFQVGDWCRDHGVSYIGHIIEDNGQHCRTGSTLGHYFRSLFGQDMAGIDDIGGQVYPQGEDDNYEENIFQVRNGEFYHFMLGKLASSLAALDPKKHGNAICEIFGNYGWEEGLRLEKYLADHFMVRGVNRYVPHAFSAAPFPDKDCPPHFYAHGHNPEYKAFGELMKYMNRSIQLISGGYHIAPVALIYPGEGEWTGRCMPGEKVARVLAENQLEFDFVPMDAFGDKMSYDTRITDEGLCINTQCYETVVVPYMQFVAKGFADDIKALTEAGIRVWFVNDKPDGLYDGVMEGNPFASGEVVELERLAEVLTDAADIQIAPKDSYIRYYHYVKEDGTETYFWVNEGTKVYEGVISFGDNRTGICRDRIFLYDPWNQKFYRTKRNGDTIRLTLTPGKSRFLVIPAETKDADALENAVTEECLLPENAKECSFADTWERSIVTSIDYPAFAEAQKVTLPDDYAKVEHDFSGWMKYENTFVAEEKGAYWLKITDAFETVEVYVNDKRVGLQIFAPYIFDLSELCVPGTNRIRIEIATTLERQMFSVPDVYGRPKPEPKEGSGITGMVELYHL